MYFKKPLNKKKLVWDCPLNKTLLAVVIKSIEGCYETVLYLQYCVWNRNWLGNSSRIDTQA